ncbi:MAG: hypothetical protein AABY95_08180 [Pseudomonadota bacterium]
MDRRSFLKLSLAGSAALSAAGLTATLTGCSGAPTPATGFQFLRDADVTLFRALIPQVLDGIALDAAAAEECLRRIDLGCFLLEAPAQSEVRKLFDLLNTGLLRRLTTGVSKSWDQAGAEEVQTFLARWHDSSVGLFNAGYRVLVKLVSVSYFCMPQSRKFSGYPGPLDYMYKAVNA